MSDPPPPASTPFDELPELTLSLRSLGSRRRSSSETDAVTEDQERYFGPLLDARRHAAGAHARASVVAAFDVQRLTALLDTTVRAFASERFGARLSARRAFEAELFEIVEPLRVAIELLGERAAAFESTPSSDVAARRERWDAWLAQLRAVFRAADDSWSPLCDALAGVPREENRSRLGWRRARGDSP
jgi:hypothetical protein